MTASFSILLHDDNNINTIVNSSQRHFDMGYYRFSPHYVTLIDKRDKCIIKISSRTLDFIINEDEKENIDKQIVLIKRFITENFINKTIGIKYDSNDININLENIEGVKIIDLQ